MARYQKYVNNKTILITGGTGSLGHALTEKLLSSDFEKIIIYSRDERKQEDMANKFKSDLNFNKLRFFIGDVRDKQRLKMACREVNSIIHAAALKIVPSVEYNPDEAVKTNIIGSQNVIEVAHEHPFLEKVLAVSTDKAVSPTNLYGATKLAMEKLIIAANDFNRGYGSKFSVVRYGNVSGSRGSVIPLFRKLLCEGKPLTVTHRDMTRFWITLTQARDFVLDRLNDMEGEEIFIPNMKSYKIVDLATIMNDTYWNYIGIRPGEKIHEEIISTHEMPYQHEHGEHYKITKELNQDYMKFIDEGGWPRLPFTSQTQNVDSVELFNMLEHMDE